MSLDLSSEVRAADVMSTPLVTISQSATVEDAASAMCDHDISGLVVTTDPPSIVTSTDVLDTVAASDDPASVPVSAVMTESVETVPPTLHVEEVAAMLTTFGIKHLPVVDGDDYLGMVSSTDVTAHRS